MRRLYQLDINLNCHIGTCKVMAFGALRMQKRCHAKGAGFRKCLPYVEPAPDFPKTLRRHY